MNPHRFHQHHLHPTPTSTPPLKKKKKKKKKERERKKEKEKLRGKINRLFWDRNFIHHKQVMMIFISCRNSHCEWDYMVSFNWFLNFFSFHFKIVLKYKAKHLWQGLTKSTEFLSCILMPRCQRHILFIYIYTHFNICTSAWDNQLSVFFVLGFLKIIFFLMATFEFYYH